MQKWLWVLSLLFALPLRAEETNEVDLLAPETVAVDVDDDTRDDASAELPKCDDKEMLQQVETLISGYNYEHQALSLLERRRRILQLRSMSEYTEERVSGFTSRQNREVADKLLMTKVNQGLTDSQIRLCKSKVKSSGFKPVYLMIYRDKDGMVHVHILNYLENPAEDLSQIL